MSLRLFASKSIVFSLSPSSSFIITSKIAFSLFSFDFVR